MTKEVTSSQRQDRDPQGGWGCVCVTIEYIKFTKSYTNIPISTGYLQGLKGLMVEVEREV